MDLAYDPIQRHLAIEKLVTRMGPDGQEKKYYRVRPARWYGGVVTADCVGCGLLCKFCWVADAVMMRPADVGSFYSPAKIAKSLVTLARRCSLKLLRISGGEPTIGKAHLLGLLEALDNMKGYRFILETNGMLIAYDADYAKNLSRFDFLHVRVSLKGCCEEEFSKLTGAKPEAFALQLEALRRLVKEGVSCHASVMSSFSTRQSLQKLMRRLEEINPNLVEGLEIEELILYPHVSQRLHRHGLKYFAAHSPSNVPPEQI